MLISGDVYSVAKCTIASILIPFSPTSSSSSCRELRIPNFNSSLMSAITTLSEVQGVTYTLIHSSVEEAKKEQEYYREKGDIAKELLANQKVQAASPLVAVPEPWDNDVFERLGIQRLCLRELLEGMKMKGRL